MSYLELTHLKKRYPLPDGAGYRLVLDIPRFTLAAGEAMALEGASGSGKTTLLHCCAGITRPDEGRVVVGGQDLTLLPEDRRDTARGQRLGYVFQTFNLIQGLSALENVELALRLGGAFEPRRGMALLKRVGLEGHARHLPSHLSAGQQQRVAVARALAKRPGLVLADEPTGNLDPASAEAVLDLLIETCSEAGAALLLVSHDSSVLRRFKRRESLESINRAGQEANPPRARKAARP